MIASLTLSAINRCLGEYINEVHDADYEVALLTGDIVMSYSATFIRLTNRLSRRPFLRAFDFRAMLSARTSVLYPYMCFLRTVREE